MNKLERCAIKLLKQNIALRKGEKVVVVTDRKECPIFQAVCQAVINMHGDLEKVRITPNRTHSSALPKLRKTFFGADVIIGITDKSITHCPETRIARKKYGTRVISMVEVNKPLFLKSMRSNQKRMNVIGNSLAAKPRQSKKVSITTSSGANVQINTIKDDVGVDNGDSTKKGAINNLPFGEVFMAPINTSDGVISIDFSRVNIKPGDNAKVIVKGGRIIGWNAKAKHFVRYLRRVDGQKALKVVELGIGINPKHTKLLGKIIHDEKILGSAHIAFGGFGDKRRCKIHEDVILLRPTVFFDDKLVIKEGKIL